MSPSFREIPDCVGEGTTGAVELSFSIVVLEKIFVEVVK